MRLVVFFEFMSMEDTVEDRLPAHQCPWAAVCEAVVPEPEVVAAANARARDEAVVACIGATSVRFIGLSSRVSGLCRADSRQWSV